MTLLDAMQIYQLKAGSKNLYSMLYKIMADGELDERVNRDIMCDLILAELGTSTVRYPDTTTIVLFGKACLLKHKREIERDIDLFETEYNQLEEYAHTESREYERNLLTEVDGEHQRTPDLVRERTDDLTQERTPDLEHKRTDDLTQERTDDLSEALTAGIETVTNEINTGDGTTSHYVSADNAGVNLQLRTQDRTAGEDRRETETRSGTDTTINTGTQTTRETGTQTTTEKGTDKTTNTGTQTTAERGTDKTTVDDQTRETGNTTDKITKHGRNTYAAKLFKDALDANALNIYQVIVNRLDDAICMQVY